jgi:hypothetical protein
MDVNRLTLNPPAYLELDLPEVAEWLPESDLLPAEVNDALIEREQALRYQPGQDRGCPFPANEPFELLCTSVRND